MRRVTRGSYFARTGQIGTQLVLPRHGLRFMNGPALRPAGVDVVRAAAGESSASATPSTRAWKRRSPWEGAIGP